MIVAFICFSRCDTKPDDASIQFDKYDAVKIQAARAAKKPIVVYVTAAWDKESWEQNRGALKDPEVKAAFEPLARFKFDAAVMPADTEQKFAELNITMLPTFLFTSVNGQVAYLVGTQTAEALIAAAAKATAR
jgi:thiol:disulfide interchange protein